MNGCVLAGLGLDREEVDGEEEFFRMDGLTGTNLQYHLLGDLMVDDDWTTTGESGRGVRPTEDKKRFATTAETAGQTLS